MNATWILSANASRARFFSQGNLTEPLEEVNDMVNAASRLRMVESTESDKRGPMAGTKSMHNTGGALPNKLYEPPTTPDVREAELFARDIASYLLENQRDGRFDKLSVVAAPQFLGMLRKVLDPQVQSTINLEIDKDYTQFNPGQLLDHIETYKAKS